MPKDDSAPDGSSTTCTFTAAELDMSSLFVDREPADVGCSRPVWAGTDAPRCVWHADQPDKPPDELVDTVRDDHLIGVRARGTDLTTVRFPAVPSLIGADLAGANLQDATLSGANLVGADLTGTNLRNANLVGADLTDATLARADLTGGKLRGADLSGASLIETDLAGADLRGANLSDTTLDEADLSDVEFNRATQCDELSVLREAATGADDPIAGWDAVARTYHRLKIAFAANGLVGRARDYHVLEQDAREQEAKAAEGRWSRAYLGSKASRYLTGYGVRPTRVGLLMLLLFVGSTVVYWNAGIENSLRYSVTTFTTSPPSAPPPGILTQATAMLETFLGTLLIVLLGYVLGNRERF